MAKRTYVNVVTPEGRVCFPHLFQPYTSPDRPNDAPKYSFTLLIPKSADITALKEEIKRVALEAFNGKIPANLHNPIQDGDPRVDEWGEAYRDCWYIRFNTKLPPAVVDRQRQAILKEDEIYSGCYGRASVTFYAYNTSGNVGVSGSFDAFQKTRDGERLGRSNEILVKAFDDLPGDSASGAPSNNLF